MNTLKNLFSNLFKRLNMSQVNTSINNHVEDYLNYYCRLSHSPKFAILLKGKWGSGKTWFINQYREKLKEEGKKSLYVSLYGVAHYSEIEDLLFQQLHPFRSSKGMVLAEKVFKGLLKGALKIDLNNDGKEDGTWTFSIPDIDIPDKFKDSNYSLLIFDDLERCNIDIKNILGYINSFVESQSLKVVILANEEEIDANKKYYKRIKEKLIGKTFEISPDFIGASNDFLKQITNQRIKTILSNNINLIKDLFAQAECKNLRILNQIFLDFERIFKQLPEKAQNKSELIQEILKLLIIFSIEISSGKLKAQDICQIHEKLVKELASASAQKINPQNNINENKNNIKCDVLFKKIFDKYANSYNIYSINFFNSNQFFPGLLWWQHFFDKGIIDKNILNEVISTSKYFQSENTPDWLKLWHYNRHSDEDFQKILNQVYSDYTNMIFEDIGIIKHITGLFLLFSEFKVYIKNKTDILNEAKNYIDKLKRSGKLDTKYRDDTFGAYMGLGFQSKDYQEFKDFEKYVKQCQEEVRLQNMPNEANKLLNIMQNNITNFRPIICITSSSYLDIEETYHDVPIFKYLSPKKFMETILMLSNENKSYIFSSLQERYSIKGMFEKLVDELDFLEEVQKLLLAEITQRQEKISGYILHHLNEYYLKGTIDHLKQVQNEIHQSNT